MGFKLMAGAVASCALIGVAVGVGIIYGSLLISIGRNPSQRDELLRYAFIGFSLVEVSGLIGLVISLLLLFGFERLQGDKLDLILYNLVPQVLTEKHISSNIISKDKNNSCITKDRKV